MPDNSPTSIFVLIVLLLASIAFFYRSIRYYRITPLKKRGYEITRKITEQEKSQLIEILPGRYSPAELSPATYAIGDGFLVLWVAKKRFDTETLSFVMFRRRDERYGRPPERWFIAIIIEGADKPIIDELRGVAKGDHPRAIDILNDGNRMVLIFERPILGFSPIDKKLKILEGILEPCSVS